MFREETPAMYVNSVNVENYRNTAVPGFAENWTNHSTVVIAEIFW